MNCLDQTRVRPPIGLIAWIFFIFLGSPCWADEPPVASGLALDRAKIQDNALIDTSYSKCGPACIYNKANENITVQIDFNTRKRNFLNNSNQPDEEKIKLLGHFCKKEEVEQTNLDSDPSNEESENPSPARYDNLEKCIKRYDQFFEFWMLKVRAAVRNHNIIIDRLECVERDQQGRCIKTKKVPVPSMDTPSHLQKAQTPSVAKASDIAAWGDRLGGHEDSQKWMETVFDDKNEKGFKPEKTDFPKFRCIEVEPSSPGICKHEIAVMSGDEHVYDEAAYKKALAQWSGFSNEMRAQIKTENISPLSSQQIKEMQKEFRKSSGDNITVEHQIYNETQGRLVDEVNQQTQKNASPFRPPIREISFNPAYNGEKEVKPKTVESSASQDNTSFTTGYHLKEDVGQQRLFEESEREMPR